MFKKANSTNKFERKMKHIKSGILNLNQKQTKTLFESSYY